MLTTALKRTSKAIDSDGREERVTEEKFAEIRDILLSRKLLQKQRNHCGLSALLHKECCKHQQRSNGYLRAAMLKNRERRVDGIKKTRSNKRPNTKLKKQ